MISRDYIYQLFIRLLEEEQLDEKEYKDVQDWLIEHPEDKEHFVALYKLHVNIESDNQVTDELIRSQWQVFNEKFIQTKSSSKLLDMPWKIFSRYAAIFILGILLSTSVVLVHNKYGDQNSFSQIVEVPYGGKSNIYLADGTEVILNAGSKLTYNTNYGDKERAVKLDGEAYFKVVKNADKPFTVLTSDLMVKAYGTEFNVKSYAEEGIIETTLIEGRVGVQRNFKLNSKISKEFFLKPNEQVSFHKAIKTIDKQKNAKIFISRNIDVKQFTAWVDDRINMKSELLSELVICLERKYNVSIHFNEEELRELRFTGVLENETIEQVMRAIKLTAPIDYKIENRDIWLTKREIP